ncbi:hypothetical protein [Nonomuraea cypriaca]|uniref:hypothetical protein n=1 Tax=Nonomuraea cypriaca TaxID=1187855 RepID=UPI0018A854E4|nr:hypothetical protein [Nonomuraea cypriaca]
MAHAGGGEQGDDLCAHPSCPVDPHPHLAPAGQDREPAFRVGGAEVHEVEVRFQPVTLSQGEIAERPGTGGRVVEGPLYDELVEQRAGPELVEPRDVGVTQDVVQIAGPVETLDPLEDLQCQAADQDGPQGMNAELEGAVVAENAPEGGLHSWPHGGQGFTPEQDPEPVPGRLWITKAPGRRAVDNGPSSPPDGHSRQMPPKPLPGTWPEAIPWRSGLEAIPPHMALNEEPRENGWRGSAEGARVRFPP